MRDPEKSVRSAEKPRKNFHAGFRAVFRKRFRARFREPFREGFRAQIFPQNPAPGLAPKTPCVAKNASNLHCRSSRVCTALGQPPEHGAAQSPAYNDLISRPSARPTTLTAEGPSLPLTPPYPPQSTLQNGRQRPRKQKPNLSFPHGLTQNLPFPKVPKLPKRKRRCRQESLRVSFFFWRGVQFLCHVPSLGILTRNVG